MGLANLCVKLFFSFIYLTVSKQADETEVIKCVYSQLGQSQAEPGVGSAVQV